MCRAIVGPRRQIKLWTKLYQKSARCLPCLISMMSGYSGQRRVSRLAISSCSHSRFCLLFQRWLALQPIHVVVQVQVMLLQGKRLRTFQDRWRTPDGGCSKTAIVLSCLKTAEVCCCCERTSGIQSYRHKPLRGRYIV